MYYYNIMKAISLEMKFLKLKVYDEKWKYLSLGCIIHRKIVVFLRQPVSYHEHDSNRWQR